MPTSIINRLTTAIRAFMQPRDVVFWGPPRQPEPFQDEILSDGWIPPRYTDPLDLDDEARETNEIRKAYREYFRREPAVRTAIEGKVASIASLDVAVQPGDEHDPASQRAAEFVDWTVEKTAHGWDGLIRKIVLPGLLDGWSVNEKILAGTEYHSKWGGLWGLAQCKQKDTAKLSLQLDRFRNITAVVSHVRGLHFHDPRKSIVFTHADLWENPFGQSDLRAAYRACYLIEEAYKLWTIALKYYAGPFMKGKYSNIIDKAKLEKAMQAARAGAWMSLRKEDDVEVINLATATSFDAFKEKINKLREEIFLTIRGAYLPFLEGSGNDNRGDTKIGKMASNDVEFLLAKAVGRVITHQLLPDLVYPNFGYRVSMPRVILGGVNWAETKAQLEVAETVLTKFRRPISAKWVYTVSQIPAPTSDEDAVQPPADPGSGMGGGDPFGGLFGGGGDSPPPGAPANPSPGAGPSGTEPPATPAASDADRVPFAANAGPSSSSVSRLPVGAINVAPERFQWRPLHDPITGVVRDRRIPQFDSNKTKPLGVWADPADHRIYLVDGHHTLDAAKRANVASLAVEFIEAPDAHAAAREGVRRNMGLRQQFAAGDWSPYQGERGGKGWKNTRTGEVVYGGQKPGAELPNSSPTVAQQQPNSKPVAQQPDGSKSSQANTLPNRGAAPAQQLPNNESATELPTLERKSGRLRRLADPLINSKVGRLLAAGEHTLAIVAHKTRDIAIQAAESRGMNEGQTDRLRRALAIGDFIGGWVAGGVTTAVAGPLAGKAVSVTTPTVSALYLAYSAARNPMATWAAARKVVSESSVNPADAVQGLVDAWKGEAKHAAQFAEFDPVEAVADLFAGIDGEQAEFRLAVLIAAQQTGHDIEAAITIARDAEMPAQMPKSPSELELGLVQTGRIQAPLPADWHAKAKAIGEQFAANDSRPVRGMAELLSLMLQAAAAGNQNAVDQLVEIGSDPDALQDLLDDDEPVTERFAVAGGWTAATTKTGKIKAVKSGSKPLYGEAAKRALAQQGRQDRGEPEPASPQQRAKELKQHREPSREAARAAWQAAVANPATVRPENLDELAAHLSSLTRDELRGMARSIAQRVGGLKADITQRIVNYVRQQPTSQPSGSRPVSEADGTGRTAVAPETPRPDPQVDDRQRPSTNQPAGQRTADRVPAEVGRVQEKLNRFEGLLRSRGQHQVADWMGRLREHITAVGVETALESLNAAKGNTAEMPQYEGGRDKNAFEPTDSGHHLAAFCEGYLNRAGITMMHQPEADYGQPFVSSASPGFGGSSEGPEGSHILKDPTLANKLEEAKKLPGLEKSEDVNVIAGEKVAHLTPDFMKQLDQRYGEGQWIVKAYGEDAAAGYGIFFPQRAKQIQKDAQDTIWQAGSEIGRYGFSLARDKQNNVIGLQHEKGDVYKFGTDKYESTINGDVRFWGDRAAEAAANERGAQLPGGGKEFMAQPAFKVVGVSDADRAAGKTIASGEGRVHIITRNGQAEVVPHSTWIKGDHLPVVFESPETLAMAQAAVDAINALPESERQGQIYAPDIVRAEDGFRVVEANPANDTGSSGYLGNSPFVIDSYVSHIAGREPAHVQFIRNLLTKRKS